MTGGTFGVHRYALNGPLQCQGPIIVSIDVAVCDPPETHHVHLILVPDQEMVRGQTRQEFQAAGLDVFYFAVGLEDHGHWIVEVKLVGGGLGALLFALREELCGSLAVGLEPHGSER